MSDALLIKGLGMLPAVAALQADREVLAPLADATVTPYLDHKVLVHEWYPVEDLIAILHLVAGLHFASSSTWDAFVFFGTVSAKRDLEGIQDTIYKRHRADNTGWYQGAVSETHTPAEALRRAFGLHQLYYDKGEFRLRRVTERCVEAELVGLPRTHEEVCALATGYAQELSSHYKLAARVELSDCKARDGARCAWRIEFDDAADLSSLAAVPFAVAAEE